MAGSKPAKERTLPMIKFGTDGWRGIISEEAVIEQKAYIGLAADGDGDRIGAIDVDGRFINPHQILALLANEPPYKLGRLEIASRNLTDGCNLYLPDGWLMFRATGTEPIMRIYAEASEPDRLRDILAEAVECANDA